MWRLDRLILQGFKSFGERTVLDFPDPVTGIIGPNGSGKSNLVEAIRFATGARAQELRGKELLTLLFQGGEGRPKAGFAEIRLELSRDGERLLIERRIEGERSILKVNGRPLGAKGLALALAGTGLGRGGYAVVGQGEIGALLTAKEEVLLGHLEEAAGLRPVAEAVRLTEARLLEALGLLEKKEEALREARAQAQALRAQAEKAQEARRLSARTLDLRRSLLLARKEEALEEMAKARGRLEALAEELTSLDRALKGLLEEKERLKAEEERLKKTLEETRLALKEAEGLKREVEGLERVLKTLDRPLPSPPPPPPPEPPLAPEEARARLKALKAEEERLKRLKEARLKAFSAYEAEKARYEERLRAYEKARQERVQAETRLQAIQEELEGLGQALKEGEEAETRLKETLGRLKGVEGEMGRLRALVQEGRDLQEGPRRVRGLPGVIGVVADLLRPEPGLEVALEAALGPRLHWVLVEDEERAKGAIAHLKRTGGRATFLPLNLLRPPPPPRPPEAPGLLGPAYRLAHLDLPQAEAVLRVLLGDTLVFQGLDQALAYLKEGGRERLVTLEGEVVERSGAITGGRSRAQGEVLGLRARLRALAGEKARLEGEAEDLRGRLQELKPLRDRFQALQAEALGLKALLARPLGPSPTPPRPPEGDPGEVEEALRGLEAEKARLEEALAQAEAHRRHQEALRAYQEALELKAEAERVRKEAERLRAALLAYAPREAEARSLEEALRGVGSQLKALLQEETRLLTQKNALLAERERLLVLLARKEAGLEELDRGLAELPPGTRLPGSPKALAQELARTEEALRTLGPVNALAEREAEEAMRSLEALEAEVEEARKALEALEAEAKGVERAYGEKLKEAFQTFQEAFRRYGEALLGAEAEARREGQGLKLFLRPKGKRVQDLSLLSLGEKTLGALAFLFALGEVQGGLPIAILDEVDAPLDEANLLRFTRFLRGAGRQFILVTHQRRTMEACDALYGVTGEGGVSRVYSIRKEVAHDA